MPTTWTSLVLQLAARAALRPRLAVDLVRTAWVFRRRGWHRGPPFLPLPDPTYLRWRMYTAYADEHAVPPVTGPVEMLIDVIDGAVRPST